MNWDWLRSRTNRHGRPFEDDTVSAYADAAIALDASLRARRGHRLAATPALWLGTRHRGPMTGSGLALVICVSRAPR
jgi:hypothetical protein